MAMSQMERNRADEGATATSYDVYEIFVQTSDLEPHVHVGSLLAPSPEWALQLARENFLRRAQAVSVWAVRRDDVHATPADPDWFAREFERKYRDVSGYADNARRWKRFKAQAMNIDDVIADVRKE
ncbi:phenylacetic acid degradation protein [Alicyclobacillus acidocaldarius]|uniref:Phenylacetic acid degradation B n=1 Tax=Alicyclobacillus acidocaldarius (strain Tc-4-1) TaxID=1048834 RepID=F8IEY0_ALIAT|nr:phenylacetic acid degradation protein [Alicyclobacillus acidocaldarius]AEJ42763.1 phenylacetic acid degradation B [Alicyclobacillus acidocaldarius subsp. acidocaldarius Tc-4-1]